MAAVGRQREREVASFDEGELWCDDGATPPLNPAGWYFRTGRGSPALWIGPFADADEAREAPFSGDSLRDARRYLDLWKRGDAPPRPRPALAVVPARRERPTPPPPDHLVLEGGQGAAPERAPKARKRRAAPAQQLTLGI